MSDSGSDSETDSSETESSSSSVRSANQSKSQKVSEVRTESSSVRSANQSKSQKVSEVSEVSESKPDGNVVGKSTKPPVGVAAGKIADDSFGPAVGGGSPVGVAGKMADDSFGPAVGGAGTPVDGRLRGMSLVRKHLQLNPDKEGAHSPSEVDSSPYRSRSTSANARSVSPHGGSPPFQCEFGFVDGKWSGCGRPPQKVPDCSPRAFLHPDAMRNPAKLPNFACVPALTLFLAKEAATRRRNGSGLPAAASLLAVRTCPGQGPMMRSGRMSVIEGEPPVSNVPEPFPPLRSLPPEPTSLDCPPVPVARGSPTRTRADNDAGALPCFLSAISAGVRDVEAAVSLVAIAGQERDFDKRAQTIELAAASEAHLRRQRIPALQMMQERCWFPMYLNRRPNKEEEAYAVEYISRGPPTRSEYKAHLNQLHKRAAEMPPDKFHGGSTEEMLTADLADAVQSSRGSLTNSTNTSPRELTNAGNSRSLDLDKYAQLSTASGSNAVRKKHVEKHGAFNTNKRGRADQNGVWGVRKKHVEKHGAFNTNKRGDEDVGTSTEQESPNFGNESPLSSPRFGTKIRHLAKRIPETQNIFELTAKARTHRYQIKREIQQKRDVLAALELISGAGDSDSCIKCDRDWVILQYYLKGLCSLGEIILQAVAAPHTPTHLKHPSVSREVAELMTALSDEISLIGGRDNIRLKQLAQYMQDHAKLQGSQRKRIEQMARKGRKSRSPSP